MTEQRPPQPHDRHINHDLMRQLFQRFSQATGEEKKALAREMMNRLAVNRQ